MNLNQSDLISNKLSQIIQIFPVDNRRNDGLPNPANVRLVQALTNLTLTRIQRDYGDLEKIKDTVVIGFCLQSDPTRPDTSNGWQGVIQRGYPDCNSSINSLRTALNLIVEMGGTVWQSQGRHKEGLLYCNVETLLLIDQACMVLLNPDLEAEQGGMIGDVQLSEEFWEDHKPVNPLRSTLKWVGKLAARVFEALPRIKELAMVVCDEAIAAWDELHQIVVPVVKTWKIETEIDFSWVDDRWLEMGDPCL